MKRRRLLIAAGALATMRWTVLAQDLVAMPRIGLLWIESGGDSNLLTALREGLSAQGYSDGKNIRIEKQFLMDRYDRLAASAESLVKAKVDIVVSYGTTAPLASSKATCQEPSLRASGTIPSTPNVSSAVLRRRNAQTAPGVSSPAQTFISSSA